MGKTSWGKSKPYTVLELQTRHPFGIKYQVAKYLVHFAAWIIKSRVIQKQTLSILEAK